VENFGGRARSQDGWYEAAVHRIRALGYRGVNAIRPRGGQGVVW
jgi:hypothetical protein